MNKTLEPVSESHKCNRHYLLHLDVKLASFLGAAYNAHTSTRCTPSPQVTPREQSCFTYSRPPSTSQGTLW